MKAKVKYIGDWCLIIPKLGLAPMLFMEWVSGFEGGNLITQIIDKTDDDTFRIKLNMKKEQHEQAARYINNNS